MSQIIYTGVQSNWYVNGTPDSVTILAQGQTLNINDIVLDTSTGIEYRITALGTFDAPSQTWTGTAFKQAVFDENILTTLDAQGWEVNTSRSYTNRASPAFATSYEPSATNDTQVLASVALTSTLLTTETVDFQVDSGSGFSAIASVSLGGVAATATHAVNFLVPAGASYKLTQTSGTGSSITSINEISL